MANTTTLQIIEDGTRNAIVKITGVLDTSNLALADFITMSSLYGSPKQVSIQHVDYSLSDQLELQLWWSGATSEIVMPLAGRGKMSFGNFGGLQNNAIAPTGNIALETTGWTSGSQVFTLILELVKQF